VDEVYSLFQCALCCTCETRAAGSSYEERQQAKQNDKKPVKTGKGGGQVRAQGQGSPNYILLDVVIFVMRMGECLGQ
jgi:hypothetical protein